jgi:threonyl-tRNA synthetase
LNWSDLCRGSEVTREKEVFVKLLKSDDAAEEYNGFGVQGSG